jgi:hypothetical protein
LNADWFYFGRGVLRVGFDANRPTLGHSDEARKCLPAVRKGVYTCASRA